jgi:recombination protein RecR
MTDPLHELMELFSRLPGVGNRTAARYVFHLLQVSPEYTQRLGASLQSFHSRIHRCRICANMSSTDPCDICTDPSRQDTVICVVESIPDLWTIHAGGTYRGRFHVLHGLLAPLDGVGPEDLNLHQLRDRVVHNRIEEVIVATRNTVEGEATALLIREWISDTGVRVTRIATGIPHGSEIEYSDARTLERAFQDRKNL